MKMKKYLTLGDSYTIGEGVGESERWPVRLTALLRRAEVDVAEPVIVAKTGWTTDELSAGIDQARLEGPYDLVSLLIGVNNQYRWRSLEQYRVEFRALLDRAIDLAGGQAQHVLVLSIPDWSVTPFAADHDRRRIAAEIDHFNAVNREETERAAARYVDVTPVSRQAVVDPTLIAPDNLHPSGKMYGRWAELALPAAIAALNKE